MRKYGNTINTRCTGDFDVCCRIECGRRYLDVRVEYDGNNVTISPRIFKGNDAEFAEFPWMLAILHEKMYKCGASLVHPQVSCFKFLLSVRITWHAFRWLLRLRIV